MKKQILIGLILLVGMNAKAQLQNLNFENWQTTNSVEKPNNWVIKQGTGQFGIFKDADAQNGNYAIMLSRWYWYTYDDAVQTAAATIKPIELSGYYKYTDTKIVLSNGDTIQDTARVQVFAKKWNAALQQNDTIGRGFTVLKAADNWTALICPIYYTSNEIPDSITIRLSPTENNLSGMGLCASNNNNGTCSYFSVDNLKLSETATGINDTKAATFALFPNPATDRLYIGTTSNTATFNYTIVDVMGKMVSAQNNHAAAMPVDIAALSKGVYFLTIQAGSHMATQKIIKQ